jgi:creatinine amidohydrolase
MSAPLQLQRNRNQRIDVPKRPDIRENNAQTQHPPNPPYPHSGKNSPHPTSSPPSTSPRASASSPSASSRSTAHISPSAPISSTSASPSSTPSKPEYAVVFPQYYFGQIFEARQQPGTVAYSLSTQLTLLQETVAEMARNGCKKVVIVNGHGGNNSLLPLFAQAQLASPRDYVVYVFGLPHLDVPGRPALKTPMDMHAGERETASMLIARPDLVHQDRATQQSGADQNRLSALPGSVYTGIWWYARFPNHYAGRGEAATTELGQFDQNTWSREIAEALKAIKADTESLKLQNQFFNDSQHPLDTKQ